jgi:hypothetical protein
VWTVKITDRTGVRDKKNNESNKTMGIPQNHVVFVDKKSGLYDVTNR